MPTAIANPFTPVFGGKPDCFFGRENILARFDAALVDRGSDHRALFITGSRGYGKTALIEQLSQRAAAAGWTTADVGPTDPIGTLLRHLAPFDETTSTLDPEVEVSVLGSGGKLKVGSRSASVHLSRDDFEYLFLQACNKPGYRLFVSIDEIQKVPLDDMALICGAFQMASRKGCDVALAIAGLPYSYDRIIHHDGCTFMRRAVRHELGPLAPCDVEEALASTFSGLKRLCVTKEALARLVEGSKGHPYMMQLEGFYAVEHANTQLAEENGRVARAIGGKRAAMLEDVAPVLSQARMTFRDRAIAPLVEELSTIERDYLGAMARKLDGRRWARTAGIAAELGRSPNQLSQVRKRLLDQGIVVTPARGELAFFIPYLADYLLEERAENAELMEMLATWQM